jgi:hypothetical protein
MFIFLFFTVKLIFVYTVNLVHCNSVYEHWSQVTCTKLLTFHVPMFFKWCMCHFKDSTQSETFLYILWYNTMLELRDVRPVPHSQDRGLPFFSHPQPVIQCIHSYLPSFTAKHASCSGKKEPTHCVTVCNKTLATIKHSSSVSICCPSQISLKCINFLT